MTDKIYLSPVASRTVDAKLQFLLGTLHIYLDEQDNLDIRPVVERNDLNLETTDDGPYDENN